ncbi:DHHA1 domain protein [Streptococcus porcinus]|nr:DHHA1 domain protein [Streptococcus porcinus]
MTIYQQILDEIIKSETIIIHRHQNPDPDAIGSQVGLKELILANFPDKRVLATGFDEPSLVWIAQMDHVTDDDYHDALVIVTDTANRPRIDNPKYCKGKKLIKIDHHPNDDVYGDISLVDTNASSASEIIADLAFSLNLTLSAKAAGLLYTGIVGDTGRFLYPATTAKTFHIASKLREYQFDFATISRQIDSFPFKIAKLQGYVFDHLEVDKNGVARVVLTQETLKAFDISEAESSAIVSAPGKIDMVSVWAIFVQHEDGSFRVRMRSKEKTINQIAKAHEGGGHPLASGANSYSLAENEQIYREMQALFD